MSNVEWAAVNIPDDKDPGEYDYRERRADILRIMREDRKAPWEMNKSELARRFDVSRTTIHTDFKEHLKPYLHDRVGEDAEFETNDMFRDAIENIRNDAERLRSQGEHAKAASAEKRAVEVTEKWYNWLFDMGAKEKTADKQEIDADISHDAGEGGVPGFAIQRPDNDDVEEETGGDDG